MDRTPSLMTALRPATQRHPTLFLGPSPICMQHDDSAGPYRDLGFYAWNSAQKGPHRLVFDA